MIGYYGYFGVALYKNIVQMQTVGGMIDDYLSVFMSFIGIILPTLTMFDWLLDKNKNYIQRTKTDWFYRNKNMTYKKMIEQIKIITEHYKNRGVI